MSPRLPYLTLALALAGAAPVFAHEGHDHGEAPLPPASYEPRFEAHAGEIEVVGILKADTLWLYASRYAGNDPWAGLKFEVEQGEQSVAAKPAEAGVYRLPAGPLAEPGAHAVVLTAQGEGLDELLTGQLVVPETQAAAATFDVPRWAWAVAALGVGALGFFALRRRR